MPAGMTCPAPCTLRAAACRVLAGHMATLNRHLMARKRQGLLQVPGSPYNRLCNPCTSPAKGNGVLLN